MATLLDPSTQNIARFSVVQRDAAKACERIRARTRILVQHNSGGMMRAGAGGSGGGDRAGEENEEGHSKAWQYTGRQTPRAARVSQAQNSARVRTLLNFARKKKPELSTSDARVALPHGTRGGELGRGPKKPSDRRRHQVPWQFNSRPHGRFAAVSEATKRDRTMTSAATAPGAASWKCTGPGRARGPLTLADAAERGIDEATNNEGRSFSACG